MSRTERLFDLIQLLRSYRYPVNGTTLAEKLGVSVRTLYRDIGTLQAQGAPIDGEAGMGYILRPGFLLPPLMFSEEELEALVLGGRWVAARADSRLKAAAKNALARISAVLPDKLRTEFDAAPLLVGPGPEWTTKDEILVRIRAAIRSEKKVSLTYMDLKEKESVRTVWPFALAFFEKAHVLAAWCELRVGFRHFRTDRILKLEILDQSYPKTKNILLQEWMEESGISPQQIFD